MINVTNDLAHLQSGAALVMSLILLSILSVLAITASQDTRTWIQAASNIRNADLAFQAAESEARRVGQFIANLEAKPDACETAREGCVVFQRDALPTNLATAPPNWWRTFAISGKQSGVAETEAPRSVIEELAFVNDDLTEGNGPPAGVAFYRITTRSSQGGTGQAIIQTVYSRRF